MTNDELRDLLYRVGETLRYDCLQSEKTVRLIHETDAALIAIAGSEQPPDHIADAGKMIAPRRLAPGETPKRLQWYWATHEFGDGTGDVIRYDPTDSDMDNYTDFFGPLIDPR